MKSLFIYVFAVLAITSDLGTAAESTNSKINFEMSEQWKLISPDSQSFILFEDLSNGEKYYSVGFYRGQRNVKTLPSSKDEWNSFRIRFVQLIESLPAPKNCPHPYRFVIERKNQEVKDKSFCFSELPSSEKTQVEKLTQDLENSIYGL